MTIQVHEWHVSCYRGACSLVEKGRPLNKFCSRGREEGDLGSACDAVLTNEPRGMSPGGFLGMVFLYS